MTKKLKYIAKCPCCETVVDERELQNIIDRKYENTQISIFSDYEYWFWERYEENGFKNWVCDDCLLKGKAIKSNISKQLFCYYLPHFAYYDRDIICRTCGDDFVYTKEQQQFYYETLQNWVQSEAVNCKKCRNLFKLNTELSNILKDKSKMSAKDFDRVIEIYKLMNKTEKAKEYSTLKNKRKL